LPEEFPGEPPHRAHEIVVSILDEVGDLSRLMEVFYFAREPELLNALRWLAALPEEARQQLADFAAAEPAGHAVQAERPDPTTLLLKWVAASGTP
jgi:hypothetical protein